MDYVSTRGDREQTNAVRAVLKGLARDGGVFMPASFPYGKLDYRELLGKPFEEMAVRVFGCFLEDFPDLPDIVRRAYEGKFDVPDVTPLKKVGDRFVLELFHGPTSAFKDVALSALPVLMSEAVRLEGGSEDILILTATSGDTGKAAMEGFRDARRIRILVFYPDGGVSPIQEKQMTSQEGRNVCCTAIRGNFDDAQTAVKQVFTDPEVRAALKKGGYVMSSANSINWGRLLPQIAYYFSAYVDLVTSEEIRLGDKVDFVVPTGNFGDILAGYYAMRMGLPVRKLLCASNINNVLTDFFETGEYSLARDFHKTISPSMDILISSNLERLLFEIENRDDKATAALMAALKSEGKYTLDLLTLRAKAGAFDAGYADEEETADTINEFFEEYGYLLDPHTAVALAVRYDNDAQGDAPTVVLSTANPYKFTQDVLSALGEKKEEDPFKAVKALRLASGIEPPEGITALEKAEVRFRDVLAAQDIKNIVLKKAEK